MMNSFCPKCQKITHNSSHSQETQEFSLFKKLIVVICEECGMCKYQYLENIEEK